MVALKVLLAEHFDTIVELKPTVPPIDPEPRIPDESGALAPLSTRSTNPTIKPFSSRYVDLSMESSDEDESDSEGPRVSGKASQVLNSTQTTLQALPPDNIPLIPREPTSNATRYQLLLAQKRSYSDSRHDVSDLVEPSLRLFKRVRVETAELAKAAQAARSSQPNLNYQEKNRARAAGTVDPNPLSDAQIRENVIRIRRVLPHISLVGAKNTLLLEEGDLAAAIQLLSWKCPTGT
jgi:hypothetical protein